MLAILKYTTSMQTLPQTVRISDVKFTVDVHFISSLLTFKPKNFKNSPRYYYLQGNLYFVLVKFMYQENRFN